MAVKSIQDGNRNLKKIIDPLFDKECLLERENDETNKRN
jgi:hypothetical protein